MITTNLCFLMRPGEILLAMKKRRLGKGKWNGAGGKLDQGETIEASVVREIKEEIGVTLDATALHKVAELTFEFSDKPDWNQVCHVYMCEHWEGEPTETEEMKPQWFSLAKIPYDDMWKDDIYWLPKVIEGKRVKARFVFGHEGEMITEHAVEEVERFVQ